MDEIVPYKPPSSRKKTTKLKQKIPKLVNVSKNYSEVVEIDSDDDEQDAKESQIEQNAYYQIHKILSSDQYQLGKTVHEYIEAFHLQYRSIKESADMLP